MDRRRFLKTAGMAGGAALILPRLTGCQYAPPVGIPSGTDRLLDHAGRDCPITHVVVVMMENRSFDHYLGWMATDEDFLETGRSRYGDLFHVVGSQQETYTGPNGDVTTQRLVTDPDHSNPWRGCGFGDPGHSWNAGRAQRDRGFLGTGTGNDELAIGFYERGDLPFSAHLAQRFTALDHSHASVLGPTYPNRAYLHSGQSGGLKNNSVPSGGYSWRNIWHQLGDLGVPARNYYSDLPFVALFGSTMLPFLAPITRYYEDCAAGTLPNVTFVEPTYLGANQEDDHPLADVRAGQRFLQRVFKAFVESPHWESGLFIVTYDEWGGFFDHVAPPRLADDRASSNDADDFGQAGFRLPTVLASPYCLPGFVDHRVYDHTSILRFLQWRFMGTAAEGPGLPTSTWFLTERNRRAQNIAGSLAFDIQDADLGFDIDGLDIDPPSAACGAEEAAALDAARAAAGPSTFQTTLDSGIFEQVGAPLYVS
ncbi:MAG: twin-arginine translocation signal domain-containing protein [Acidimicrobiales bacterium]|nr:twin-arginine translocation signal domain-containing protein [Acidimicrobiales bacterium]